MKKILIVYTGGTICSFLGEVSRELNVSLAKSVIVDNFSKSDSSFAHLSNELFEDSCLNIGTLSENMTIAKQNLIIDNIRSYDLSKYKGVIVLHGTDTLAYTASLFALVFSDSAVPVMMVSANRPPDDPLSNANDNFKTAVELIMHDIAPNVYVPYRNSDDIIYLHIASSLMQCGNFSEDFYSTCSDTVFPANNIDYEMCRRISSKRVKKSCDVRLRDDSVLLIHPYTGLDYSRISLDGINAIVHGTYHSGTVCVERSSADEKYGTKSILHLADRCRETGVPIFISPSSLGTEQYSSVYDAAENGSIIPLNMTAESAYAKAVVGTSLGYSNNKLSEFMKADTCDEIGKP